MARVPSSSHEYQLTEAIARKKARLRILEARLRKKEKAQRHGQYIAAGKVVEGCGLLHTDLGELATILKRGIEATKQMDATAICAHEEQGEA
jgi:hypothetical protein